MCQGTIVHLTFWFVRWIQLCLLLFYESNGRFSLLLSLARQSHDEPVGFAFSTGSASTRKRFRHATTTSNNILLDPIAVARHVPRGQAQVAVLVVVGAEPVAVFGAALWVVIVVPTNGDLPLLFRTRRMARG